MPVALKHVSGSVLSNSLIVHGFMKKADGTAGIAETAGVIQPKDFLVGVNGDDLSDLPFKDAILCIRQVLPHPLTQPLTELFTDLLTHPVIHSLTHSLIQSLIYSPTLTITHSPTHFC